jgi:hypothetical protein
MGDKGYGTCHAYNRGSSLIGESSCLVRLYVLPLEKGNKVLGALCPGKGDLNGYSKAFNEIKYKRKNRTTYYSPKPAKKNVCLTNGDAGQV